MDQKVLKVDDLNPDGLRITVDWEDMSVGASIFVPCVNTEKGKEQLNSPCIWELQYDAVINTRWLHRTNTGVQPTT